MSGPLQLPAPIRRERLYFSTIAPDARQTALDLGAGLELAYFCTASNMDEGFAKYDPPARQDCAAVKRKLFHAPFNELCPAAIDPKARDLARFRYLQAARLAAFYGIGGMVAHSGFIPLIYYEEWFLEESVKFWTSILGELPPGMTLYIENVLEDGPELLGALARAVNHPRFRLCLDVGHANVAPSRKPLSLWLEACGPHLEHFHLHNNTGAWDTHSGLGEGSMELSAFLRQAAALRPNATFTVETLSAARDGAWLAEQKLI